MLLEKIKVDTWYKIQSSSKYNNWYIYIDSESMYENYYVYLKQYLSPKKGVAYDYWFATLNEVLNQLKFDEIFVIKILDEETIFQIIESEKSI